MNNAKRLIAVLSLVAVLVYMGTVFSDKQILQEQVVRLHVVANSDSQEDQAVKLDVKDAVVSFVEENLVNARTVEEAKNLLQEMLPQIQAVANAALSRLGQEKQAVVSFLEEAFPTKDYEGFSLPAGVYQALKVTIGEGQGQNWWCVVFPSLCMPAGSQKFQDTAVGAGFTQPLADTLAGEEGYELRFFFLEMIGRLENLFQSSKEN